MSGLSGTGEGTGPAAGSYADVPPRVGSIMDVIARVTAQSIRDVKAVYERDGEEGDADEPDAR